MRGCQLKCHSFINMYWYIFSVCVILGKYTIIRFLEASFGIICPSFFPLILYWPLLYLSCVDLPNPSQILLILPVFPISPFLITCTLLFTSLSTWMILFCFPGFSVVSIYIFISQDLDYRLEKIWDIIGEKSVKTFISFDYSEQNIFSSMSKGLWQVSTSALKITLTTQCVQRTELTLCYLLSLNLSRDHLYDSASGSSSDFSGHGNSVVDIVILKQGEYSFLLCPWAVNHTIQFSSIWECL